MKIAEKAPSSSNIFPQYEGMHSKVVAELLRERTEYIDPSKDELAKQETQAYIDGLRAKELQEEHALQGWINSEYADFSDEQKHDFSINQQYANDIISEIIRNEIDINSQNPDISLSAAEFLLISDLQDRYQKAQRDGKLFNPVDEIDEIDSLTFMNLQNRLAVEMTWINESKDSQVTPASEIKETGSSKQNDILYGEFSEKNGETQSGYWWYEYSNEAAKHLKEKGKFEWGKERIYFDVSFNEFEKLRDLMFRVATEQSVPIAFKYLDTGKSAPYAVKDPETTRFVANFASIEDAKIFFDGLSLDPYYQSLIPSTGTDYSGYKLDEVATYANGYREKRKALDKIVTTAVKTDRGYRYLRDKEDEDDPDVWIDITDSMYEDFSNQYKSLPSPEKMWNEHK